MKKKESEVLSNILDNGCAYLDDLLKKHQPGDPLYKLIIKYVKNYITEEDIFNDSRLLFINYMKSASDIKMWTCLCESDLLEDLAIGNLIVNFIHELDDMTFEEQLLFLKNIISSSRVRRLMYEPSKWKFNTGHHIEHSTWVGKLINHLDTRDNSFDDKATKLCTFLTELLEDAGDIRYMLEESFVNCFASISNLNIGNRNIGYTEPDEDIYDMSSDKFLLNSTYLLLKLWDVSKVSDISLQIDISYITNINCPIKWYTRNTNTEVNYSWNTKLFFLVLNSMRVCYTPLLMRATDWPHLVDELDKTREALMVDGGLFFEVQLLEVYSKIKTIKDRYTLDRRLTTNSFVRQKISQFYSDWMNASNTQINWDDTLDDMTYFYINSSDTIDLEDIKKIQLVDFGISVVESQKITKNPEKRDRFVKILDKIINENSSFIQPEQMSRIINSMIQVIEDYDSYNENLRDYFFRKMNAWKFILLILTNYSIGDNKRGGILILDQFFKLDTNKAKKFISILYNSCYWLGDQMDSKIDKIKNSFYLSDVSYNSSLVLYKMQQAHEMLMSYIGIFITNIPEFKRLTECPELLTTLVTVLNSSLCRLNKEFNFEFSYLSEEDMQLEKFKRIDMIKYFFNIMAPYLLLTTKKRFLEYVVGDVSNFKVDYIKRGIQILKDKNLSNALIDPLEKYVALLQETNISEETDDYPEEFLDPLTCVKIENPVILPVEGEEEEVYMEEYVIKKHLLINSTNPFTRKTLTIDQLEEFNSRPNIAAKLEAFKKRIP